MVKTYYGKYGVMRVKPKKITCAFCGKGIRKGKEVSYTDGKSYHVKCINWMSKNPDKWW